MASHEKSKIYVDSCVYINYLNSETNKLGRPMGPDAFNVFVQVQQGKYQLILSTWVIEEMSLKVKNDNDTTNLIETMEENIIRVGYTQQEKEEAMQMTKTHWQDALHIIIARREGAEYLITNNLQDYRPYGDLVTLVHPRYF